jgi:hypothetical protein
MTNFKRLSSKLSPQAAALVGGLLLVGCHGNNNVGLVVPEASAPNSDSVIGGPFTDGSPNSDSGVIGGPFTDGSVNGDVGSAAMLCPAEAPMTRYMFATVAEKRQALVGRWIKCSRQAVLRADAVGIEIAADASFTFLVRDAAGMIVAGKGVFYTGKVAVTESTVNFVGDIGLTEQTDMIFTDAAASRMFALNTNFIGYDYIRDRQETATCSAPSGSRVWQATSEEFLTAATGRWLRCGRALTSDESEVQLQIGADRRFSILVKGPGNAPVPSSSLFGRGQVTVVPAGMASGHPQFDLTFADDAGSGLLTRPIFTDDAPRQMLMLNTNLLWQQYVYLGQ